MKKIFAILLTAALAFSVTGCGNKNTDDNFTQTSQGGASVDENGNAIAGTTIDGAGKEVDMKKVDGVELNSIKAEGVESEGAVGAYNVSIESAKLVDVENGKVLIVSFGFKNKSSEAVAFDNVMSVDALQGDTAVNASVITGYDGINILSAVELIESGKSTTVQKAYTLTDTETPVEIMVYKYAQPGGDKVVKTFNLK